MTNAYTIEGSLRCGRNTHSNYPTKIIMFSLRSNWQLFSFGAVALKRVKTRMREHLRGQASAELGENPNRDTVHYFSRFSRQSQAVALTGYQIDKRRIEFEVANDLETRTTSAALSLSSEF